MTEASPASVMRPIAWTSCLAFALIAGLTLGSAGALAATPAAPTTTPSPHHASSDTLWRIVHDRCVPHQAQAHDPAPCAAVSPPGRWGYALLKDLAGPAQFLLIPSERITGIEDFRLLQPGGGRFWVAAWNGRDQLERRMGGKVPRDGIGLAINSVLGRTQNQLHIHIDCVRPDVVQALKAHGEDAGNGWGRLALPPNGHDYAVRKFEAADLRAVNPFALVAGQGPDVSGNMATQTIAVIGATFRDGRQGFYLLNDRASIATHDPGAAEELLDQSCGIAR
jgi:CDP-diacylglycerol pyrophosphatase